MFRLTIQLFLFMVFQKLLKQYISTKTTILVLIYFSRFLRSKITQISRKVYFLYKKIQTAGLNTKRLLKHNLFLRCRKRRYFDPLEQFRLICWENNRAWFAFERREGGERKNFRGLYYVYITMSAQKRAYALSLFHPLSTIPLSSRFASQVLTSSHWFWLVLQPILELPWSNLESLFSNHLDLPS